MPYMLRVLDTLHSAFSTLSTSSDLEVNFLQSKLVVYSVYFYLVRCKLCYARWDILTGLQVINYFNPASLAIGNWWAQQFFLELQLRSVTIDKVTECMLCWCKGKTCPITHIFWRWARHYIQYSSFVHCSNVCPLHNLSLVFMLKPSGLLQIFSCTNISMYGIPLLFSLIHRRKLNDDIVCSEKYRRWVTSLIVGSMSDISRASSKMRCLFPRDSLC